MVCQRSIRDALNENSPLKMTEIRIEVARFENENEGRVWLESFLRLFLGLEHQQ